MPKLKHTTRQALLDEFMNSKANLSPLTQQYYRYEIVNFLNCVKKYICNIEPKDIEGYINNLKRNPGGKDSTYRAIWTFWSWAVKRKYAAQNYFEDKLVSRPKLGKRIFPFHSREQLHTLLAAAPDLRTRALIALLADSGARVSEILRITPSRINFTAREILINGKGDKDRFIQFGPSTEAILKEYLASFNTNDHKNIWRVKYRWNLEHMLTPIEKQTGIKCNPHTFRRSFAITLRKRNISPLAIMDLGGWEDIDMVLHYTRGYDPKDSRMYYEPIVDVKTDN